MTTSDKAFIEYRTKLLSDFLLKLEKISIPTDTSHDGQASADTKKNSYNISTNIVLYQKAKENFHTAFGDMEYFFENLAVTIFFDNKIPHLHTKEDLWKSYVNFCNVYSLLRFVSIAGCRELVPNQKDLLFEGILFVSRTLLHSPDAQKSLDNLFFENESSSLAHMAVLLSQ